MRDEEHTFMHNQCHTCMYVIVCSHLSQFIAHSTQCTCTHFIHQFSALITAKPLYFVMNNASHILCFNASHNCVLGPFIPYTASVQAFTHTGGGAVEVQTTFTQEGGTKV